MQSTAEAAEAGSRAGVAGWLVLGLVALLGAGGAAAWPGGWLLGVPGPWPTAIALAGLCALALLAGCRAGAPALGLAWLPALLLAGVAVPGIRALSGPPLLAIAAGAGVLALARSRSSAVRFLFLPVALAAALAVSARVQARVGPEGDEPHYLMVADSLLRDGDLGLERDYAEGRYEAFHPAPLAPHYRVRGRNGEIYSLHALGLSLLVLPAYALGGYPLASFFMAGLLALLALELRGLLREAGCSGAFGDGAAWVAALSPPLLPYAGLIFTEVPAALVVALGLRRGPSVSGVASAAALGAAIAFLPWLNVRYAPLAALLLLYALAAGRPRRIAVALLAPALVSALALAAYHQALYGFFDPRRVYGARPELSLALLPEGLAGLLLDQEFGLLVYAPAFALSAPGLWALLRRRPGLALAGAAMLAAVLLTAGSWPMWRGGFNPPARFLVPVVPVLALGLAERLRGGVSAGAALLIGWGLFAGASGAVAPQLLHRDRDGTAPLFRAASGAEEWTRLLPGYVLEEPDRHKLAGVWTGALALAVFASRGNGARALASASLGLLAATGLASHLSEGRTGGRDAVRLLGTPALEVPGLRLRPSAPASWGPDALRWGPLYEPHRHADGAEVGARLPLLPGSWRLTVDARDLGAGADPPWLEVRAERRGSRPGRSPLAAEARTGEPSGLRLSATFEVTSADGPVRLALRGGGPLLLDRLNLLPAPGSNRGEGGRGHEP